MIKHSIFIIFLLLINVSLVNAQWQIIFPPLSDTDHNDKTEEKEIRGEVKSALIDLNRTALTADYDGIEKEGWQFTQVPFRYQFVNCGGEVQMGVSYDKTTPLVSALDNGIRLVHKGKVYYKSDAEDIWPESKDIEIGDIKATLYFQNLPLGDVKLNNIVGNFAGCFGETFLVLNDVGKNPSDKLYRDNLDKFELRNIKIIRGDVNLSYKRKQEIIKAISYDAWGNPKSKSSENSSTSGKQYDAFGNPINTKSSIQAESKTDSKQNTKYDAFGNPINSTNKQDSPNSNSNNITKQKDTSKENSQTFRGPVLNSEIISNPPTPDYENKSNLTNPDNKNITPKKQYDVFGNPNTSPR